MLPLLAEQLESFQKTEVLIPRPSAGLHSCLSWFTAPIKVMDNI